MANEATVIELYGANSDGDKRRYACASGASISKGTLLTLSSDPRTVTANSTSSGVFAGIASSAKDGTDFSTSISAWTNGIFDLCASGAINLGQKVTLADNNKVKQISTADLASSLALVVGVALETATDAEVINVRVLI